MINEAHKMKNEFVQKKMYETPIIRIFKIPHQMLLSQASPEYNKTFGMNEVPKDALGA
jgi:hypothetical protein